MKNTSILSVLTFIFCLSASSLEAQENNENNTRIYFIRHAEKDRSNPDERNPHLTQKGFMRAEKWAHFFKDIPITAVYSTNYHRTLETAAPTAKSKNISVQTYDPRNLDPAPFMDHHKGEAILIVGHSNTTPAFVNAFLGIKKYKDLSDSDNASVFLVRYGPLGKKAEQYHVD